MASQRIVLLSEAPTEPVTRVRFLEALILKLDSDFQQERVVLNKKIRFLEESVKEAKKKTLRYRKKLELFTDTRTFSNCGSEPVTPAGDAAAQRISQLQQQLLDLHSQTEANSKCIAAQHTHDLRDKDCIIQRLTEQINFLKQDYRELQEAQSTVSLEYVKATVQRLLEQLPLLNPEAETVVDLLMKMLGFSVLEKLTLKQGRNELANVRSGLWKKWFK